MASIGPVEYVVIGFPGNRFKGEIVPAVAELVDNDIVRIIDVAFIKKDPDGNATMFEYDTLDDVLAFGFADVDGEAGRAERRGPELAAEALEPDSSAALVVWEHRWAARVSRRSGMRAGGSSPASGYRTRSWSRRWPTWGAADGISGRSLRRYRPCCASVCEEWPSGSDRHDGADHDRGWHREGGCRRAVAPAANQGAVASGRGAAAPADPIAQLKELAALKEQGVLTEEEFTAQKARILGT